jgi:wyosine [tRNA(Phe)-imidazoG37] synthetase (radical SAM superfamily)
MVLRNGSHELPGTERAAPRPAEAFTWPRDFLDNRFVYVVISPRAGGLSVGINMNPDKKCNFDCAYCEVDRTASSGIASPNVKAMTQEFERTLLFIHSGQLRERPAYAHLPNELLELRHVTLSGDGEPTLCPKFEEAVEAIVHTRARARFPFFKIVLVTNGTGLDLAPVQRGLRLLKAEDEVWAKLDVGTQADMDKANRSQVPLAKVLSNILLLGRQRSIVVQSLFPMLGGQEPSTEAIESYAHRLQELTAGGVMIASVQVYSATRPRHNPACGHLPLKTLSRIARTVRSLTGLRVEVF